MDWKDTVMSANNIATLGFGRYTDKNMVLYGMEIPKVLEKQAEISFKAGQQQGFGAGVFAGRKEVVEWVKANAMGTYPTAFSINIDSWKSQLKVWGVES